MVLPKRRWSMLAELFLLLRLFASSVAPGDSNRAEDWLDWLVSKLPLDVTLRPLYLADELGLIWTCMEIQDIGGKKDL